MGSDMMDVEQLAAYLRRNARRWVSWPTADGCRATRSAANGAVPRAEINHWLESQIHGYTDEQLTALESGHGPVGEEPLLAGLLSPACVAVPLPASTKASVLKELVTLAEQSLASLRP